MKSRARYARPTRQRLRCQARRALVLIHAAGVQGPCPFAPGPVDVFAIHRTAIISRVPAQCGDLNNDTPPDSPKPFRIRANFFGPAQTFVDRYIWKMRQSYTTTYITTPDAPREWRGGACPPPLTAPGCVAQHVRAAPRRAALMNSGTTEEERRGDRFVGSTMATRTDALSCGVPGVATHLLGALTGMSGASLPGPSRSPPSSSPRAPRFGAKLKLRLNTRSEVRLLPRPNRGRDAGRNQTPVTNRVDRHLTTEIAAPRLSIAVLDASNAGRRLRPHRRFESGPRLHQRLRAGVVKRSTQGRFRLHTARLNVGVEIRRQAVMRGEIRRVPWHRLEIATPGGDQPGGRDYLGTCPAPHLSP